MPRTISIELREPRTVELTLDGLGVVRVGRPPWSSCLWRVRPTWQNHQASANELLASCVRPRVNASVVARLTQGDRRRTMLAVIRLHDGEQMWRGLYGTHLSLDERFCAVMLWTRRREAREVQVRLRELAATAKVAPVAAWGEVRGPSWLADSKVSSLALQRAFAGFLLGAEALGRIVEPKLVNLAVPALARLANQLEVPRFERLMPQVSKSVLGLSSMNVLVPAPPAVSGLDAVVRSALGFVEPFEATQRVRAFHAEVGALVDTWENDALWYLLSALGLRVSLQLTRLGRHEAEQLVLDALETVVRKGDVVAILRQLVREAVHLDDTHRAWLDHGLEHAQRGEWVLAVPYMHPGIEGALRATGIGMALVARPRRAKKVPPAEVLIKSMGLDPEYTRFVVVRVFGGEGNKFRHGLAEGDARSQVLLAVVALVGWAQVLLDVPAMDALARWLGHALQPMLDQARPGATVKAG